MVVKKRFTVEKWFEDKLDVLDIFKLVRYSQNSGTSPFFVKEKVFHTLLIDLERDIEDIFKDLRKGTRTNVKRARRDNIEWEIFDNKKIDYFIEFCNEFRESRDLSLLSLEKLSPYLEKMVVFRLFDNENNTLVLLSFLVDKEKNRVRPFYVGTKVELTETITRTLLGYANAYSYWAGIEYFKEQGFKVFDMGGITPQEDNNKLSGITNFKLGFSNNVVTEHHYISPLLYLLTKVKKS